MNLPQAWLPCFATGFPATWFLAFFSTRHQQHFSHHSSWWFCVAWARTPAFPPPLPPCHTPALGQAWHSLHLSLPLPSPPFALPAYPSPLSLAFLPPVAVLWRASLVLCVNNHLRFFWEVCYRTAFFYTTWFGCGRCAARAAAGDIDVAWLLWRTDCWRTIWFYLSPPTTFPTHTGVDWRFRTYLLPFARSVFRLGWAQLFTENSWLFGWVDGGGTVGQDEHLLSISLSCLLTGHALHASPPSKFLQAFPHMLFPSPYLPPAPPWDFCIGHFVFPLQASLQPCKHATCMNCLCACSPLMCVCLARARALLLAFTCAVLLTPWFSTFKTCTLPALGSSHDFFSYPHLSGFYLPSLVSHACSGRQH